MYQLRVGVPVKAVRFTGINFMEVFTIVDNAGWFIATPNQSVKVYYTRPRQGNRPTSFHDVEVLVNDWLVIDDAGPIVVEDDAFHSRYEWVEN